MDDAKKWRETGREVVGMELEDARYDVGSALYAITVDTMFQSGDSTPGQVKEARMALNFGHQFLEQYVTAALGCKPCGDSSASHAVRPGPRSVPPWMTT